MSQLINKILKEATKQDDPFFQPKTQKREEELKKKRKELTSKIKLGLQNIKVDYKNKNWNSEEEKLFLQIFSKLYLDEKYNKQWSGYFLKDENNKSKGIFDLEYNEFWISNIYIWEVFEEKFHWKSGEIQSFMKRMLKKHFKLYEFTPGILQ